MTHGTQSDVTMWSFRRPDTWHAPGTRPVWTSWARTGPGRRRFVHVTS